MKSLVKYSAVLLVLLCMAPLALAQVPTPTPAPAPIPPLGGLAGLVVLACTAASWALRYFSNSDTSFFHTKKGAVIMAVGSALIPALTQWGMSGHLSASTLTPLIMGAMMSLFASSKPLGRAPAALPAAPVSPAAEK